MLNKARKFAIVIIGFFVFLFLIFISQNKIFAAPHPPNPIPVISDISPNSATVGSPNFTMTISGTGFVSNSRAQFNGQSRNTTFISDTQLTVVILANNLTAIGTFPITVVNNPPGGGTSNAQIFTVVPVTVASPSGGGTPPTSILFSGKAYPGAEIDVIAKNSLKEMPIKQSIVASPNGDFNIIFGGVIQDIQSYGLLVKDKDGQATQTKFYNLNQEIEPVIEKNIFTSPTIGLIRSTVSRGDYITAVGYAIPNSSLELNVDGDIIGQKGSAGPDGYYKISFNTANLNFGVHALWFKQIGKNGEESDSSPHMTFIISKLFTPETDLNNDGIIDIKDFSIFLTRWQSNNESINQLDDFDKDGKVDIKDFSIFIRTIKK